jgi:hypothetical protein
MFKNLSSHTLKFLLFTAVLALLTVSFMKPAQGALSKDLEKLLPPRTAVCWYDADRLEDLILNCRGKLTFIFIDNRLGSALQRQKDLESQTGPESDIQPAIYSYARKHGKRKHILILARVESYKFWTFDTEKISVGGYTPKEGDIITGVASNPSSELHFGTTELAGKYDGFIGFYVPDQYVKPGAEIKIGYESDLVDWQVPDKNH